MEVPDTRIHLRLHPWDYCPDSDRATDVLDLAVTPDGLQCLLNTINLLRQTLTEHPHLSTVEAYLSEGAGVHLVGFGTVPTHLLHTHPHHGFWDPDVLEAMQKEGYRVIGTQHPLLYWRIRVTRWNRPGNFEVDVIELDTHEPIYEVLLVLECDPGLLICESQPTTEG